MLFGGALYIWANQDHYTLDIRVRGQIGDGHNPIEFDGKRFGEVAGALAAAAAAADPPPFGQPAATLAIGPEGFADVNVDGAKVTVSDPAQGTYTMTFRGMTTDFFDTSAEMLATARWQSAEDTQPQLSLFFRYEDVDLVAFEPSSTDIDVEFSEAWITVSRNSGPDTKVDPDHFPEATDYFDDGIAGTADDFSVATTFLPIPDVLPPDTNPSEAVVFRGVVRPDGLVGDVANQLGLSRQARIDGKISMNSIYGETCPLQANGSFTCSKPSGTRPKSAIGLSLTASFEPAETSTLPKQIALDAGWTFTIAAQLVQGPSTDTIVDVKFGGSVAVELYEDKLFNMGGEVQFTRNTLSNFWSIDLAAVAKNVELSESVKFKEISLALGFTTVSRSTPSSSSPTPSATASPSGSAQTGRITGTAVLDLEPLVGKPGEVPLQIQFAAGTAGFSFTVSGAVEVTDGTAAGLLGDAQHVPAFNLNKFGLAISIVTGAVDASAPSSTPSTPSPTPTTTPNQKRAVKLVVTITAQTSITLSEDTHVDSDVLVIVSVPLGGSGGGTPARDYLVVAKPASNTTQNFTLSRLSGKDLESDWELPNFFLSVASRTWEEKPDFLNPAVAAFVETQDGPFRDKLLYREGVNLKADVALPTSIANALQAIGAAPEGKVRITAAIPLFGSVAWGAEIALPRFTSDKPGPFRGGQLKLVFGRFWVDAQQGSNKTERQFGVIGDVQLEVRRETKTGCESAVSSAAAPDCFDQLQFRVGAAFVSGTKETSIQLRGNLLAADGWDDPFGVKGLTVHSLGVIVGVVVPVTGQPGVTVGMSGAVDIARTTVDDPRTVNLSFLLRLTPAAPWITPMGFTFAVDRLELRDLVELHNMLVPAADHINPALSGIPDLRLESVYFAFGTIDEPSLCIRAGFFLAAELHHGGTPGGSAPACNGSGNVPPSNTPLPTESCTLSRSCIAAVLVDVQLFTTVSSAVNSKVLVNGYFAGAELGPLVLDETIIDLELSAKSVHFRVSGGAKFRIDGYDLAEGSFFINIQGSKMELKGEVALFEEGLVASVHGVADLDFDRPDFKLKFYFAAPALEELAEKVGAAFEDLGEITVDLGEALVEGVEATVVDVIGWIERIGKKEKYDPFEGLSTADEIFERIVQIDGACQALNRKLKSFAKQFPSLGLGAFECDARTMFESALFGTESLFTLPGVRLGNGDCYQSEENGKCVVPFPLHRGYCNVLPGRSEHPICDRDNTPGEVLEQAVVQDFAVGAAATTGLSFSDQGLKPEKTIRTLYEKIDQGKTAATCATFSVDTAEAVVSDLITTLDVDGAQTTFNMPINLRKVSVSRDEIFQPAVEALVNGDSGETCDRKSVPLPDPPLTAEFKATSDPSDPKVDHIDEGGTVWAHGEAPGANEVEIDWADGSTPTTVATAEGGSFAAKHRFVDDGMYDIGFTGGGSSTVKRFRVVNVAPKPTVFQNAQAFEGQAYSVHVSASDVGEEDTLSVTVFWGDFTSDTYELPGGEASVSHTYADEGDTGKASVHKPVVVEVADDDGGRSRRVGEVAIFNLEPEVTIGGPEHLVEAENSQWEVTVTDPGVLDVVTLTIDWADGTVERVPVEPSETGDQTRTVTLEHAWADDDPTGSPSDFKVIEFEADDGDAGVDNANGTLTLRNVAPTVTLTPVEPETDSAPDGSLVAAVDETVPMTWTVNVDDPGLPDTHDVTIDWGDGSTDNVKLGPSTSGSTVRSAVVSHSWDDDDPSGTPKDLYTVSAVVIDDDRGGGTGNAQLMVRNVAPTVTELTTSVSQMDENQDVLTLDLAFADPSLLDSHTITVDWGEGWTTGATSDTDVSGLDVRATVVDVPAPTASVSDERSLTLRNRYGDDGTYTITVTIRDDDAGDAIETRTLVVDNVTPGHAIDKSTATGTAGGPTWLLHEGQGQTFSDTASDPGSEDLRFDWSFGDGTFDSAWWLRSTGAFGERTTATADQRPSPQVGSVASTSFVDHAWADACLYGVSATVSDDDDATAGADFGAVAVQRAPDGTRPRNFAQWRARIKNGEISQATLDCYLDVAGHLSSVLWGRSELDDGAAGGDPTPWSHPNGFVDATARDEEGVPVVLTDPPERHSTKLAQEQAKFDRALLAVLLSYSEGAFTWHQLVENGHRFADALADLESIRRTSTTHQEVMRAWQRLNALTEGS